MLRLVLGVVLTLAFVITIAALIFITESALNVWDRLREGPPAVMYAYIAVLAFLVGVAIWLIVRLLVRREPPVKEQSAPALSRDDIEGRLRAADDSGVDVSAAQAELAELAARQSSGSVHLCFFGEISTGKSSLIKALVPDAEVAIDVVGGSTDDIRHYRWRDERGTQILLTDVPGTAGLDGELTAMAIEEAQRAQIVLYVCDGDLARAEKTALAKLAQVDKPMILVMNKSDRYSAEEQALLMERLLGARPTSACWSWRSIGCWPVTGTHSIWHAIARCSSWRPTSSMSPRRSIGNSVPSRSYAVRPARQ